MFESQHLVTHVDLGEAECAEMRVGSLHRWLDGVSEQLFQKLADERPHLLHGLTEERQNFHRAFGSSPSSFAQKLKMLLLQVETLRRFHARLQIDVKPCVEEN